MSMTANSNIHQVYTPSKTRTSSEIHQNVANSKFVCQFACHAFSCLSCYFQQQYVLKIAWKMIYSNGSCKPSLEISWAKTLCPLRIPVYILYVGAAFQQCQLFRLELVLLYRGSVFCRSFCRIHSRLLRHLRIQNELGQSKQTKLRCGCIFQVHQLPMMKKSHFPLRNALWSSIV